MLAINLLRFKKCTVNLFVCLFICLSYLNDFVDIGGDFSWKEKKKLSVGFLWSIFIFLNELDS